MLSTLALTVVFDLTIPAPGVVMILSTKARLAASVEFTGEATLVINLALTFNPLPTKSDPEIYPDLAAEKPPDVRNEPVSVPDESVVSRILVTPATLKLSKVPTDTILGWFLLTDN